MITITKMTVADFIREHNFRIAYEQVDSNPNNPDWRDARHYKVVLSRRDGDKYRRLTIYFSQGHGIKGEPDAARVLRALALDVSSVESRNFEEWAREYGYDPDSRRAEQIYRACQKQARKLRKFLGEDLYLSLLRKTKFL